MADRSECAVLRSGSDIWWCFRARPRLCQSLSVLGRCILAVLIIGSAAFAQDINAMRDDQINRLKNYVVDAMMPSGLVRDSLVLNGASFHPATPDAAGFELLGLSALSELGKLPDAEQRVQQVLSAYAGQTPGVTPERSNNGFYIHFMNISTGAAAGDGWDTSYTPIGTALLVAGAEFAHKQFPNNANITSLTNQLTNSVNFNDAISPSLNGGIYLDVGKAGTGNGGTVNSWNEFMLVESLALRDPNNARALAIESRWLNTNVIPKISYNGIPTLTDNAGSFAPAFWVQDQHFFNGDFRNSDAFETYFRNQQQADKAYSSATPFGLGQSYRYGLTAGVSPQGYNADSISNHPNNVFSPEAVAAWGDMDTLLQFYNAQNPNSNPSYKYGLTRVSATQPSWIPSDAGLVDHMFLLFGLVESLEPDYFKDHMFAPITPGDYNVDGVVDMKDYSYWASTFGSTTSLAADGNNDGIVDTADYAVWRSNFGATGSAATSAAPEPASVTMAAEVIALLLTLNVTMVGRRPSDAKTACCDSRRHELGKML
jgi:hypothetical protein